MIQRASGISIVSCQNLAIESNIAVSVSPLPELAEDAFKVSKGRVNIGSNYSQSCTSGLE